MGKHCQDRPADHGRRMSLEDFEQAKVQEGYLYELAGGSSRCPMYPIDFIASLIALIADNFSTYEVSIRVEFR